ncbi:hypothetical protein VOLCADRAFT_89585 [Volvox carteri f. nagariensis]|uniref:Uncharacterized protein n=1 Tax=Volvox carteri f. nagariensis TaxID=3068 RepID=D8TS82_VOLCA|nr:uncharacterized protein VOLCADRAFT_89585 [Volvox carteri f. nagariensis]EFJ49646.1 hypothetical protein VOLCADRAFT_89585 [Volvox carteri f. nagariensis]|eukprot:XP_002949153.1 hypothetical protein VOLCADRAFT_89585 [Volvox carteri f. nagariensis]
MRTRSLSPLQRRQVHKLVKASNPAHKALAAWAHVPRHIHATQFFSTNTGGHTWSSHYDYSGHFRYLYDDLRPGASGAWKISESAAALAEADEVAWLSAAPLQLCGMPNDWDYGDGWDEAGEEVCWSFDAEPLEESPAPVSPAAVTSPPAAAAAAAETRLTSATASAVAAGGGGGFAATGVLAADVNADEDAAAAKHVASGELKDIASTVAASAARSQPVSRTPVVGYDSDGALDRIVRLKDDEEAAVPVERGEIAATGTATFRSSGDAAVLAAPITAMVASALGTVTAAALGTTEEPATGLAINSPNTAGTVSVVRGSVPLASVSRTARAAAARGMATNASASPCTMAKVVASKDSATAPPGDQTPPVPCQEAATVRGISLDSAAYLVSEEHLEAPRPWRQSSGWASLSEGVVVYSRRRLQQVLTGITRGALTSGAPISLLVPISSFGFDCNTLVGTGLNACAEPQCGDFFGLERQPDGSIVCNQVAEIPAPGANNAGGSTAVVAPYTYDELFQFGNNVVLGGVSLGVQGTTNDRFVTRINQFPTLTKDATGTARVATAKGSFKGYEGVLQRAKSSGTIGFFDPRQPVTFTFGANLRTITDTLIDRLNVPGYTAREREKPADTRPDTAFGLSRVILGG